MNTEIKKIDEIEAINKEILEIKVKLDRIFENKILYLDYQKESEISIIADILRSSLQNLETFFKSLSEDIKGDIL